MFGEAATGEAEGSCSWQVCLEVERLDVVDEVLLAQVTLRKHAGPKLVTGTRIYVHSLLEENYWGL